MIAEAGIRAYEMCPMYFAVGTDKGTVDVFRMEYIL